MVRDGCGQPGQRTQLYLKNVSQEWVDGMNWFLCAGVNSGKLKVISMIFGWMWSKLGLFMRPRSLLNEFMNWAYFLHADCDAIIFGKTNIVLYIFDF